MIKLSIVIAILMTLCGCTNDLPGILGRSRLSVSFEKRESRVAMVDDVYLWYSGDEVALYNNSGDAQLWEYVGKEGRESGYIASMENNELISGDIVALYPYRAAQTLLSGRLYATIAARQCYDEQSDLMLSRAVMPTTELLFKPLMGYLCISLTGEDRVESVTIRGNNNEILAADVAIDIATGVFEIESNVAQELIFDCSEKNITLSQSTTYLYFAIAPQLFELGITATVLFSNGSELIVNSSKPLNIDRGDVVTLMAHKLGQNADRQRLIELYNAMGGENWKNNTNWCSDRPLSEWYGVYTYRGRVYKIDLMDNNLVGVLPPSLSELSELKILQLAKNNITGSIPQSYGNMKSLGTLSLYNNRMSGEIPTSLNNTPGWRYTWGYAILNNRYNRYNLYQSQIVAPEFDLRTLSGQNLRVDADYYAQNNYTILFQWSVENTEFVETLKSLYERYRHYGLDIVSWTIEGSKVAQTVRNCNIEWTVATVSEENPLSRFNNLYYPVGVYPAVTMFDSSGQLVFSDTLESRGNIVSVVDSCFDSLINTDLYYSTDFSADGSVTRLQSATEGVGIDVVIMGDGFSDRLVADGTYMHNVERAAEAMFVEEPMKSFRGLFNIYAVTTVSLNESYGQNTKSALDCYFGEGTLVGGNDKRCFEYAKKAVGDKDMDDVLIVVVINSDRYAGTTYNYYPAGGNYGSGAAIAYIPLGESEQVFEGLISHEAVGHGFAKLDDEYVLDGMGTIPMDQITFRKQREAFGWYKNTDIRQSVHFVKWSHLLADRGYTATGLGVFEGASTYAYGVFRPTEQSLMNRNTDGFNPPSREALYYRMHRLAYGESWEYSLEEFKKYDYINLLPPNNSATLNGVDNQIINATHPPVVRCYNWSFVR